MDPTFGLKVPSKIRAAAELATDKFQTCVPAGLSILMNYKMCVSILLWGHATQYALAQPTTGAMHFFWDLNSTYDVGAGRSTGGCSP